MTLSLWTEASRDLDAEAVFRRMANAKVAVAGLWPFLTLAASESEFEHRLALASDHIANAVPVDLLEPVHSSLREDYRLLRHGMEPNDPNAAPGAMPGAAPGGASGAPGGGGEAPGGAASAGVPAGGGTAPAGGSSSGLNAPQPGTEQQQPESVNTPMTTAGSKNAEGEDDADDADEDGKPDWLQEKIKGKESAAYWHTGRQRWVAASRHEDYFGKENQPRDDYDDDRPTRQEAERDAHDDYLDDVVRKGPSKVSFWHHGSQRWVVAAVDSDENAGGGNPYYFTGGPEAGPNTGQSGQFPPHPTGADPESSINGQFPMQPEPWTVPPGGEWKEVPMNFSPPLGNQRGASRLPFVQAKGGNTTSHRPDDLVDYYQSIHDETPRRATVIYGANHPEYGNHYKVRLPDGKTDLALHEYTHKVGAVDSGWSTGDFSVCDQCPSPIKRVHTSWGGAWTHTGAHGMAGDDDHEPTPRSTKVDKRGPRSDSPHHRYTMPATGRRVVAEEGAEGRPGPNPHYFSEGGEGVSGDQERGFPDDITLPEDTESRVDEFYGQSPISGGYVDYGQKVANQGGVEEYHAETDPDFSSEQERERWRIAQDPDRQQGNRASAARHTAPGGGTHKPYRIEEHGDQYKVVNDLGEVKGTHDTHDQARDQQKALYANAKGHRGPRGFYDPADPGIRTIAAEFPPPGGADPTDPIDNEFAGGAAPNEQEPFGGDDEFGGGETAASTSPRQLPSDGGGDSGENPFGDDGVEDDPSGTPPEAGHDPKRAFRYRADALNSYERPSDADPTGAGDEYAHRTWDGPLKTRPRQDAEDRKINTPQSGGTPIPTVSSPGPGDEQNPGEQRQARLVADLVTQNLGGPTS